MTTLYYAVTYDGGFIEPREVTRIDGAHVWIAPVGDKRARFGPTWGYFDTEAEARAFIRSCYAADASRYRAAATANARFAAEAESIASRWSPEPTE